MSSLATCLRKAGKAINGADAASIREIHDDYVRDGMTSSEAARQAIADFEGILLEERQALEAEAKAAGAPAVALSDILYSAESKEQDIASKLSIVDILYGNAELPGLSKKPTVTEIAKVFSKRARALNGGKPLSGKTARSKDIISEVMANEIAAAMQQTGHAGHWYSATLREAISIASIIHPELNTDPHARTAFLIGMAVTSNGATVEDNTKHAEEVYTEYKKKGGVFPVIGHGDTADAMKKAFKLFNDLKKKWGMPLLNEFLYTEFTVAELKLMGLTATGELADTTVFGSAIFGPKVGNAFFQNVAGNFNQLTMDRWWMRTWGRIVGNLAPEGISAAGKQQDKLISLLDSNRDKVESLGYTISELETSDKKLLAFARKVHREYVRGGFKDKTELNRAAKNFDNAVHMPVIAPRNGAERNWIREVVKRAQEKLAQRGIDADIASMQALLWYPEKELYLKLGVGNERSKPTDYSKEFARLAASRGIPQSRIDGAIAAAGPGQLAGDVGADVGATITSGSGASLTAKARKQLLQTAATRSVRKLGKNAFTGRVPKGPQRKLGDAPVSLSHTMNKAQKNSYARAGLATPSFLELAPGPEAAKVFMDSIMAAKGTKAVPEAYKPQMLREYEDAHLFLTEDGMAGFALEGDRVTSIFKHPKAVDMPGTIQAALRLAVERGARTMIAPEGLVPHMAAMQGFKGVARVQTKKDEIVYMVYDQHNFTPYSAEGVIVDTMEAAQSVQEAARNALDTRNTPDRPIRYRLDDELDPNDDLDPSSPISQLNKYNAVIADQAANGPASAAAIKASMGDFLAGGSGRNYEHALAIIPRRNLRDFVSRKDMPAATEYVRVANRMDGRRNELLAHNEEIARRWTKYISKNKNQARVMGELMHASTIAGVDPSKPYRSLKLAKNMTHDDKIIDARRRKEWTALKAWWDKMDTEAQEIYTSVRDAYSEQRTKVEAALEKRIAATAGTASVKQSLINDLRQKFEAGRVAGPYFPLSRFGDLWAVAKDAKGNVIAFSKFEKVSEQREWMKAFREEGLQVDGGKKMDDMQVLNRIDPGFVAKVTSMADALDTSLADEIWQLYLRSMPEMSMRKSLIHRKGRLGFSADAVRSFGHNMFHGSHQLAKLEHMHVMEGYLEQMKEQARTMEQEGNKDVMWGNAVFKEMVKRHDWARNPKSSLLATKLTTLGFAWYLGATPAAAFVNLTQTVIVGLPTLAAKFNWMGATAELGKAAALYAGSRGPMKNRLRGDERAAMEEFDRIGLFDKTQAHDLAGVSEEGIDYSSKMRRTVEIISWMFHKAEEANRQVTALAAYRLARRRGDTHEDAILLAEDLTWDSHFDYNNVNRPRVLQSNTAKVLLLFRQYSLNMTYRLARDFNDSIKGASPEVRKEARTRFGGILIQTMMFGGISAMPMVWAVTSILEALLGDDDEPFDAMDTYRAYLTELWGSKAAEAIIKGPIDALTGLTMSNRISLSNLWIREAPANLEGDDLWMHYIGEAVGPIPAIPKDYFQGYQYAKDGQMDRALEKLTPKVAKDALKTWRFLSDGVQNQRGDVIIPKEEFTVKDAFYQAIGFTPAKLTMQYEQNRAVGEAASFIQRRRAQLTDRLFLSYRNQDQVGAKETMAAIAEFNKKNPSVAIGVGNIISSAKSRADYSSRAVGGITIDPKLQYLHNRLRFTPRGEE